MLSDTEDKFSIVPSFRRKIFLFLLLIQFRVDATEVLTDYASHYADGRSIVFTSTIGQRLRITPYGDYIVRVQFVRNNEDFFPDNRYEMVESHDWNGAIQLTEHESFFYLETRADDGVAVKITKNPVRISFFQRGKRLHC